MPESKKILIIDDDKDYLEAVSILLEEAGYTVQACPRPEQGLAMLRTFKPQCLVMDLRMPNMTGEQLLPWVRCQAPELPIIICTANDFDAVRLNNHGVRWILRKPFSNKVFFDAIEQALAQYDRAA